MSLIDRIDNLVEVYDNEGTLKFSEMVSLLEEARDELLKFYELEQDIKDRMAKFDNRDIEKEEYKINGNDVEFPY